MRAKYLNRKKNNLNNNDNKTYSLNQKMIEYNDKIYHKFIKNPNFKYKSNVISKIDGKDGYAFEIFISFIDNKEYIAFQDSSIKLKDNHNICFVSVFGLLNNKKIISLKIDAHFIDNIKYFINKNNYNEYLITIDYEYYNVFDITNNYKNVFQINKAIGIVVIV